MLFNELTIFVMVNARLNNLVCNGFFTSQKKILFISKTFSIDLN